MTSLAAIQYAVVVCLSFTWFKQPILAKPANPNHPIGSGPVSQDYKDLQAVLGHRLTGSTQEKNKIVDLLLQLLEEIDLPRLCEVIANDTSFLKSSNDVDEYMNPDVDDDQDDDEEDEEISPTYDTTLESSAPTKNTPENIMSNSTQPQQIERIDENNKEDEGVDVKTENTNGEEEGNVVEADENEDDRKPNHFEFVLSPTVKTQRTGMRSPSYTRSDRPLRRRRVLLPASNFYRRINSDGTLPFPGNRRQPFRQVKLGDLKKVWAPISKINGLPLGTPINNIGTPREHGNRNRFPLNWFNMAHPKSQLYSRPLVLGKKINAPANAEKMADLANDMSALEDRPSMKNSVAGKDSGKIMNYKVQGHGVTNSAASRPKGKVVRRIIYRKRKGGNEGNRGPVRYRVVRRMSPKNVAKTVPQNDMKNMMLLKRQAMKQRLYQIKSGRYPPKGYRIRKNPNNSGAFNRLRGVKIPGKYGYYLKSGGPHNLMGTKQEGYNNIIQDGLKGTSSSVGDIIASTQIPSSSAYPSSPLSELSASALIEPTMMTSMDVETTDPVGFPAFDLTDGLIQPTSFEHEEIVDRNDDFNNNDEFSNEFLDTTDYNENKLDTTVESLVEYESMDNIIEPFGVKYDKVSAYKESKSSRSEIDYVYNKGINENMEPTVTKDSSEIDYVYNKDINENMEPTVTKDSSEIDYVYSKDINENMEPTVTKDSSEIDYVYQKDLNENMEPTLTKDSSEIDYVYQKDLNENMEPTVTKYSRKAIEENLQETKSNHEDPVRGNTLHHKTTSTTNFYQFEINASPTEETHNKVSESVTKDIGYPTNDPNSKPDDINGTAATSTTELVDFNTTGSIADSLSQSLSEGNEKMSTVDISPELTVDDNDNNSQNVTDFEPLSDNIMNDKNVTIVSIRKQIENEIGNGSNLVAESRIMSLEISSNKVDQSKSIVDTNATNIADDNTNNNNTRKSVQLESASENVKAMNDTDVFGPETNKHQLKDDGTNNVLEEDIDLDSKTMDGNNGVESILSDAIQNQGMNDETAANISEFTHDEAMVNDSTQINKVPSVVEFATAPGHNDSDEKAATTEELASKEIKQQKGLSEEMVVMETHSTTSEPRLIDVVNSKSNETDTDSEPLSVGFEIDGNEEQKISNDDLKATETSNNIVERSEIDNIQDTRHVRITPYISTLGEMIKDMTETKGPNTTVLVDVQPGMGGNSSEPDAIPREVHVTNTTFTPSQSNDTNTEVLSAIDIDKKENVMVVENTMPESFVPKTTYSPTTTNDPSTTKEEEVKNIFSQYEISNISDSASGKGNIYDQSQNQTEVSRISIPTTTLAVKSLEQLNEVEYKPTQIANITTDELTLEHTDAIEKRMESNDTNILPSKTDVSTKTKSNQTTLVDNSIYRQGYSEEISSLADTIYQTVSDVISNQITNNATTQLVKNMNTDPPTKDSVIDSHDKSVHFDDKMVEASTSSELESNGTDEVKNSTTITGRNNELENEEISIISESFILPTMKNNYGSLIKESESAMTNAEVEEPAHQNNASDVKGDDLDIHELEKGNIIMAKQLSEIPNDNDDINTNDNDNINTHENEIIAENEAADGVDSSDQSTNIANAGGSIAGMEINLASTEEPGTTQSVQTSSQATSNEDGSTDPVSNLVADETSETVSTDILSPGILSSDISSSEHEPSNIPSSEINDQSSTSENGIFSKDKDAAIPLTDRLNRNKYSNNYNSNNNGFNRGGFVNIDGKNVKLSGMEQLARLHGKRYRHKPRTSVYNRLGSEDFDMDHQIASSGEFRPQDDSSKIDLWKAYNIAVSQDSKNTRYDTKPYGNYNMWNSMPWPVSSAAGGQGSDWSNDGQSRRNVRQPWEESLPGFNGMGRKRMTSNANPDYGNVYSPYSRMGKAHEKHWGNRFSQGFYGRVYDDDRFNSGGTSHRVLDSLDKLPHNLNDNLRLPTQQGTRRENENDENLSSEYIKSPQVVISKEGQGNDFSEEDLRHLFSENSNIADLDNEIQTNEKTQNLDQSKNKMVEVDGVKPQQTLKVADSNKDAMGNVGGDTEAPNKPASGAAMDTANDKWSDPEANGPMGIPVPGDYTCPKMFGYHMDPNDCQSFFICSWGVPYRLRCPAGTRFNPDQSVCDWAVNVACPMGQGAA